MKKIGFLLLMVVFLVGCSDAHFMEINQHQDFIATVNIDEPSLSFFDTEGQALATWDFEVAYTGGTLIQHDRVLMYGHELTEAHLYELSTGEKIATIDSGSGTTNAYYDEETALFFMTNSKTNTVTSYDLQGEQIGKQQLYHYPMSMTAQDGKLYVINYKDTVLSVLDCETLQVLEEWPIEKSSHGMIVVEDELWIGGHGQGSQPNATIDVYDKQMGELKKEIATPLMPVGFSKEQDEIVVISHGDSKLYKLNTAGALLMEMKIGANPFAVEYFNGYIVVAGYDDHTLYFIENGDVVSQVMTKAGPFQLLVREITLSN